MTCRVVEVVFVLALVAAVPPAGRAAECEGRCEDGRGAVAVVNAGACGEGEDCRAGCETDGAGNARPHAACVVRATGEVAARPAIVRSDARRE